MKFLQKLYALVLCIALLSAQIPTSVEAATSTATGTDTLGSSTTGTTSAHSIAFTTKTNLDTGDKIQLYFPDFTLALTSENDVTVTTGPSSTIAYSNSDKSITLTLSGSFSAGSVVISVADGKITNPAAAGEYSVSILTLDSSNGDAVLDSGIAKAGVANQIAMTINVAPAVSNVTSSNINSTYSSGSILSIQLIFNGNVDVTGTPTLALNSGGTATYSSGTGTSTLNFRYEIGGSDSIINNGDLNYASTAALALTGNDPAATIKLAGAALDAVLTLPALDSARSLAYNKDLKIGGGYSYESSSAPAGTGVTSSGAITTTALTTTATTTATVIYPYLYSFDIQDQSGITSDSTPLIMFSASSTATKIILSCNGGIAWSSWINLPATGELNTGSATDFDIVSGAGCNDDSGLRTITAKVSDSYGNESSTISDSTVYEPPVVATKALTTSTTDTSTTVDTTVTTTDTTTAESDTSGMRTKASVIKKEVETTYVRTTLDIPTTTTSTFSTTDTSKTVSSTAKPVTKIDNRLIEVGYVGAGSLWKSVRSFEVQNTQVVFGAEVEESYADNITVRVIGAEKLEDYSTGTELTTSKPVLPTSGGVIPFRVKLESAGYAYTSTGGGTTASTEASEAVAEVEIPAGTSITDKSGSSYEYVVYAPEIVTEPPESTSGYVTIRDAVFMGSSSGTITFDQPVLINLPVKEKLEEPQIYHFDESRRDWILTQDAISGEYGGDLNENGKAISISVDHMTLFSVVGIEDVRAIGVSRAALGSNVEKRASFSSGEWFSSVDIGNDDRVSFAWSGFGDVFSYEHDDNPFPGSVTADSPATTNFYLDDIDLPEGTSYLHILAESNNGIQGAEEIFVINYDKTSPDLLSISGEIPAGGYKPGDMMDFSLNFSEPVRSTDLTTVYFNFGGVVEIPAIPEPIEKVTGSFEIVRPTDFPEFKILAIVGMFVDRAGLIIINPEPLSSQLALNDIRNAQLSVRHPAEIVDGRYFTKKDSVTITPSADGAVKMKLGANVLLADQQAIPLNQWIPYRSEEFDIALSADLGARKIMFTFVDETGKERSAGVIVTRLAADQSESTMRKEFWDGLLDTAGSKVSQKLKGLIAWGLSLDYDQLLAKNPHLNPAILEAQTDSPSEEKIAELHAALASAQEVRELTVNPNISARKVRQVLRDFGKTEFSLADFLSPAEINAVLTKIESTKLSDVATFIDFEKIAVRVSRDGQIFVSEKSLGARDSDGDNLTDRVELILKTNPYITDSDGDGLSDSTEVLELGNDPLTPDAEITTRFSNLTDNMILADPQPILRGTALAGETVQIVALAEQGEGIILGTVVADSENKWLLIPEVVLPAGVYKLQLREGDQLVPLDTISVTVNLDFILLPPRLYLKNGSAFAGDQPTIFGNTFYGATIVAIFDNGSTAVIADNPAGDFAIRPPEALELGEHTLIVYAELSDGTRSPARVTHFTVVPEVTRASATVLYLSDMISLKRLSFVALLALLTGGILWIRRRRKVRR